MTEAEVVQEVTLQVTVIRADGSTEELPPVEATIKES